MNRRSLLRLLPLGLLPLPTLAIEKPINLSDPSPWVETDCPLERYDDPLAPDKITFRCGTRYKFLRGATPMCPNCGTMKYISDKSIMGGIEVKK